MPATLIGVSASPGIVVGSAHLLRWEVPEVRARVIEPHEVAAEIQRLRVAVEAACERLRAVKTRAEEKAGPAEAAIFDVQIAILQDGELRARVETLVRQNLSAEKAFDLVMLEWREHFGRSTNPMMRERVGDLVDVHIRLLSLLLELDVQAPSDARKAIVTRTLDKMAAGGIYDHLGGGFARYSVDPRWLVPHFEKMLYDQAGLLKVLTKMSQFYPSPLIFDGILLE